MTDDIVAELDWLANTAIWSGKPAPLRETLRRARAEIVAMRERCALHDDLEFVSKNELKAARAEERERCAQIVESYDYDHMGAVAAAIRHEPS
jgi:hypothetical protein